MGFQYSPYAALLLVAAATTTILSWYALRRRQQPQAFTLGLMTAALSWWSLFYALHISGADLETQHLFNRLKYIGVMAVPPLWLIMALQYTGKEALLTRRNLMLLFLPAALLLPIVLTDHLTHFWWAEIWEGEFNGQPALESRHSLPYYIHIAISYLFVIWGLWLYTRFYLRTQRVYRLQAGLMIIAGAIPLIASMLTQLNLSPLPWGLDSFFFTLSSILIVIAIFRYQFLDIMPVAHQLILEQIPDGVIVVDASGRVVDANPAARTLLDLNAEPVVGQALTGAMHNPEIGKTLRTLIESGEDRAQSCDIRLGGRVLTVRATELPRQSGEEMGQIILLRDVTERIQAQTRLEEMYRQTKAERERLALTIGTVNNAIVLLDAQGQILESNPAADQILRARHQAQFPQDLQEVLDQVRETGQAVQAQINIGQSSFQVAAALVPNPGIGADANNPGLVMSMHDVTHLRQLAQLKDDFVSTVSHDLRAPLTSILGYAQIAQSEHGSEERRSQAIERIEMAAQRMSYLISDLLDLATLEAGLEHESWQVDLNELVTEAIEDLEGAALARGIRLQSDLENHPPLIGDPRLLTQVWRNLIGNAIKYTEQGTVTVRVRAEDQYVRGEVIDTGIGISPSDLPYVFDKFYRSKRPYAQGVSGTGLGLALVKSIIEKHDGRIWVESQLGNGSRFIFQLPVAWE